MFGVNKKTNLTGILLIIWQIAKIVIPLVLPGAEVSAAADTTVMGTIAGVGLMSAKDDNVTGAGTTGPDMARKVGGSS